MSWSCPDCDSELDTYSGVASHHAQAHNREVESLLAELRGDDLCRWYVEEKMSENQVAKRLDVSRDAVSTAFQVLGIERRSRSEAEKLKNEQKTEEERRQQTESAREKLPDGGGLAIAWDEQFEEMQQSASVNATLGAEHREENGMKGVTGQDHPRWNGGKSIYDAVKKQIRRDESWETTRTRIRKRQDGECTVCSDCPDVLDVHHIVPLMAGGCNADELLMGLCSPCHRTVERYLSFEPVLVE